MNLASACPAVGSARICCLGGLFDWQLSCRRCKCSHLAKVCTPDEEPSFLKSHFVRVGVFMRHRTVDGVFGAFSTFVAVLGVCSVEVVDGIDRMQLDLGEISVADPVELRSGLGGRGPRHVSLS